MWQQVSLPRTERKKMGFFSRLFGGKKKNDNSIPDGLENIVNSTLDGLLSHSGLDLSYELEYSQDENGKSSLSINFFGADEEALKEREGQLLEAVSLFVKRVVQHNLPEDRTSIQVDTNGYKEESSQALIDLADKLKGVAIEKGKSVYIRALPPKDRKIIHQHLAGDTRIKSRSIGEGLFKKIKIYPAKQNNKDEARSEMAD